jgi:hypothetical protein
MEKKDYYTPLFRRISIILFAVLIFLVVVRILDRQDISAYGNLPWIPDKDPIHEDETLVLKTVINLDTYNGSQQYIYTGWDMRLGAGQEHGRLGILDEDIFRSFPFSVRLDPSSNADFGIENEGLDRSIWPLERIPMKAGDRVVLRGYAMIERNDGDVSKFWVSPQAAGDTLHGPHDCPGGIYQFSCPYMNRGGARAGLDFRNAQGVVFDYDMRIIDWSMKPYEWHYFEMSYVAKKGTISVMPWLQGFEATAPASVWFDDVELYVYSST